jgi:hypothetical protein
MVKKILKKKKKKQGCLRSSNSKDLFTSEIALEFLRTTAVALTKRLVCLSILNLPDSISHCHCPLKKKLKHEKLL